jgi:hypothetical protein
MVTTKGKEQKNRATKLASSPPQSKRQGLSMWTLVQQQQLSPPRPSVCGSPFNDAKASGGSLLVSLSPKEKESDEDNNVKVVSSVEGRSSRTKPP